MKKQIKNRIIHFVGEFIQHVFIVILADLTMEIFKRLF